jgi:chorismate mutase
VEPLKVILLLLICLLSSGCVRSLTATGDVYACDKELLEMVAKRLDYYEQIKEMDNLLEKKNGDRIGRTEE